MAARTTAAPSHARAESRSSSQIAATSAATSASDARRIDARTGLIHCCAITCTENAMPEPRTPVRMKIHQSDATSPACGPAGTAIAAVSTADAAIWASARGAAAYRSTSTSTATM